MAHAEGNWRNHVHFISKVRKKPLRHTPNGLLSHTQRDRNSMQNSNSKRSVKPNNWKDFLGNWRDFLRISKQSFKKYSFSSKTLKSWNQLVLATMEEDKQPLKEEKNRQKKEDEEVDVKEAKEPPQQSSGGGGGGWGGWGFSVLSDLQKAAEEITRNVSIFRLQNDLIFLMWYCIWSWWSIRSNLRRWRLIRSLKAPKCNSKIDFA